MEQSAQNHRKIYLALGVVFCLIVYIALAIKYRADSKLRLSFCDVGQGDATLVSYNNFYFLIDTGSARESGKLLTCLNSVIPFWNRRINAILITHTDEDHFGGLVQVLKRFQVDNFYYTGERNDEIAQQWLIDDLKKLLIEHKVCTKMLKSKDTLKYKKIYFDILSPKSTSINANNELPESFDDGNKGCGQPFFVPTQEDNNNRSLVLRIRYGDFSALLTGDAPTEVEQALSWRNDLTPVSLLKIGHHGSGNSTSDELLKTTKPQLAVISVGENSYGHPNTKVLEKLDLYQIKYLRTDQTGTISIITDGKKWKVAK